MSHNQPMASPTRSYGGVTAVDRSARRRAAVIDVCLDLYSEGGARAVTKRAVCQRARLNDRYFYEHFTDSTALLRTMFEELTNQGLTTVTAAIDAAPPEINAQVQAAATTALHFLTEDPRRAPLLLNAHVTDQVQEIRLASIRQIAHAVSTVSCELLGENVAPTIDSEMAAYAFVSGTLELVAAWMRGDFPVSQDHLVNLITTTLMSTTEI